MQVPRTKFAYSRRSQAGTFLALILTLASAAVAQVNAVYVESNIGQTTNKNSVYAYSNDGTGKLTAISGSPFLTNGTGVFSSISAGAPGFQADQEIVVNPSGNLLFAVNGHSNTISAFKINGDGSLTLSNTGASNGQDPVSLGFDGTSAVGPQMTVVNQAADPNQTGGIPNITSFLVDNTTGALTPVSNSTVNYPTGSLPADAVVSPSGKFVFVVQFMGGGALSSYNIASSGLLTLNNSEKPSRGPVFLGAAVHPKRRVIYAGMPAVNMFGVYTYNTVGTLALGKIIVNPGMLICWMTTDPKGNRLYTSEAGSNTVTVYDISGANFLKPVQLQHFTLMTGGNATNLKLDPTGAFLYVLGLNETGATGNFLHVLNVSSVDGTLTETLTPLSIPVPSGEIPQGLAVVKK
jgi:6-phosphogluconolactonase (cycloisomerase 2 family)